MFDTQNTSKHILTVSKLNRLARSVLEVEIGQIWLSAEISNFVAASSGHWYFTLKDDRAQVKAAMFKGANRRVVVRPKSGDKVLVKANLSLYEPRGDYQLIVEHMEPEGEGRLKQQFEQLKRQLAAEGLFAQEHKQPIPDSVLKVGVVTSPTGAALHDILTVLARRNPAIEVVVYPTQVQGDTASFQICEAIRMANDRKEVEVLIVGRGGGSLEDLWCFNDEQLARAIFTSNLPIISAVGHEVDVSIADFSADLRAPTPSAAAELVSQDQQSLLHKLAVAKDKLLKAFNNQRQVKNHLHQVLQQKLLQNHPQKQLEQKSQQVDQLQSALVSLISQTVKQSQQKNQHLHERLTLSSPARQLEHHQNRLKDVQQKLYKNCQQSIENKKHRLASNSHILDTVSPLSTLSRGYSISFAQDKVVKSTAQVKLGQTLTTRVEDGEILSTVHELSKQ